MPQKLHRIRYAGSDIVQKYIQQLNNCEGVMGACEDQDEHEVRSQFETNFHGTLNILQLSLPHFRAQNHGRYLIFSSTSGALGTPGLGPFTATKYAVEGLIESMLYEVDVYNIKATLVEPGHMRLDEPDVEALGLKKYSAFKVKSASKPYSGLNAPAGHAKRMVQWLVDRQPVSTVKSAELVWQLAHCSYPPLRLLLGSYAVESIRDRLRSIIEEVSFVVLLRLAEVKLM
jgi:NAD(P)-dependent dehydrogenase (short-subunit alcohol dehydrogenase family)